MPLGTSHMAKLPPNGPRRPHVSGLQRLSRDSAWVEGQAPEMTPSGMRIPLLSPAAPRLGGQRE